MDFLKITQENADGFEAIAKTLFNEYLVKTKDSTYRLTEIEFYWNSDTHKDECTYNRKYVSPNTGEWFFHYSGVDIALKNEETNGYGGILIRGIYDINTQKLFKGPMVCAMKLFSGINAFEESICTRIVATSQIVKSEIEKGRRVGLGKNATANDAHLYEYNFENTALK